MSVILKPPTSAPSGCNSNIILHAERVDYTVNNVVNHRRAGTKEGRCVQLISSEIQMNITGYCIAENGNTIIKNCQILECAANNWGYVNTSTISSYPKVSWHLGDEYMMIQDLTFTDNGDSGENRIEYLITLYIDTRS